MAHPTHQNLHLPPREPSKWKRLACFPWDALQLRLDRLKTGEEFLRYFEDLGRLKPDHAVLDVGCGRGRMAVSLTRYLNAQGRYEGFDVMPANVTWCARHISRPYPRFHFTFPDVFNAEYNPAGKTPASKYVFPYEDATFDFVLLTSVFTHMLPGDLEHYLSEIARVTRKGGRCLATFFLLNPEALQLIEAGRSSQDFRHRIGDQRTTDPATPEAAIAYEERDVRDAFPRNSFRILEPFHYGSWCSRAQFLGYQDIVVAEKL